MEASWLAEPSAEIMGVENGYSMVKLSQGTVGTRDQDRLENIIKVYPDPAKDLVTVQLVTHERAEVAN